MCVKLVAERGSHPLFPASDAGFNQISFATASILLFEAAFAEDAYTSVCYFKSGIIVALLADVLVLLLTQASFHVFIYTWSFNEAYTYPEIWKMAFGRALAWIPLIFLIVAYLVCTVNTFGEIDYYIPNVVVSIWPNVPTILMNSYFLQYMLLVLLSLPAGLAKRISSFAWA
jgi:hypothetical protein